jgi:hypothetical protein
MPGIIDSFIVEWILDPAKYIAGRKKLGEENKKARTEEEKLAKQREIDSKRAAEGVAKVRNEVVGLFLAFQGASSVKSFITDMLAGDAATGRLAKNLNTSTNELSAWQIAVRSAGGEAQDANSAFGVMAQLLQNFKNTGLTGQESNLRALGLAPGDLSNPAEALLKLADARERFVKSEGEAAGSAHFYGLAKGIGLSDAVINTLVKGRLELTRQISELERHGAATDEDAKKAAEFEKKWAELQARISGAVRPEIYRLVTAILDLTDGLEKGTVDLHDLSGPLLAVAVLAGLAEAPFIALAAAIGFVAVNIDKLRDAWKGYEDWYNNLSSSTDTIFDPVRRALGMKTGAEARRDHTDVLGWPTGGIGNTGGGAAGAAIGGSLGGGGGGGQTPEQRRNWAKIQRETRAAGGGGGGGAGVEDVYQYFRQQGYSDAAARGIAAGVFAESGGRHNRYNEAGSGAYGLAQWLSKDRLADFRRTYGHDLSSSSRAEQLAFIAKELRTTEGGAGARIRGSKSAYEALHAFVHGYERPGAGAGGDLRRGSRYLAGVGAGGTGSITINGGVTVNTPATDADGIARDLIPAIRRRATTTQANRGLD